MEAHSGPVHLHRFQNSWSASQLPRVHLSWHNHCFVPRYGIRGEGRYWILGSLVLDNRRRGKPRVWPRQECQSYNVTNNVQIESLDQFRIIVEEVSYASDRVNPIMSQTMFKPKWTTRKMIWRTATSLNSSSWGPKNSDKHPVLFKASVIFCCLDWTPAGGDVGWKLLRPHHSIQLPCVTAPELIWPHLRHLFLLCSKAGAALSRKMILISRTIPDSIWRIRRGWSLGCHQLVSANNHPAWQIDLQWPLIL